jgi:hypothetical protein
MSDTTLDTQTRLDALFASRSGSDRIRMACDMFDLARALIVASIKAETPAISGPELRAKIFDRTYRDDFRDEDRIRILARLGR